MKTASGTLVTLLATSNQFYMTETYTFTLADGSTLVYTNGDPIPNVSVSSTEPQAPIITH